MRGMALAAVLASGVALAAEPPPYDPAETMPGGAATAAVVEGADPAAAFARPVGNLPAGERARFGRGVALFYRRWVAAPAQPPALAGLGPLYNALSCQQCHLNDGRGRPPTVDPAGPVGPISAIARFAPPAAPYGRQLQDHALQGLDPEGRLAVAWTELRDGRRRPIWRIQNPAYGAPPAFSVRIAPPLAGLGLLEAVAAAEDAAPGSGRFGWRRETWSIREQTARAFRDDMGVAADYRRFEDPAGDCTALQTACRAAAGAGPEAAKDIVADVAFYVSNLGPPARSYRQSPEVMRGRAAFYRSGCADCHTPSHMTGPHRFPWLSGQKIWPYTDLALHDMGPGLADAGGAVWRTPPLWGLGRNAAVNGADFYLHDGRARSVWEAILWHGGEAAAARDAARALTLFARGDLLAFLESL